MPSTRKCIPAALEGFSEYMVSSMELWKVPGAAVAVVLDGHVVYSQGFGYRDVARKHKVTPETLFAIGSASKAFTTMSMAILVDGGKLDWDRPVREYLPTFKLMDPFATDRVTPRDLVCHRSGLPRHDMLWYGTSSTRKDVVDRLQYLQPNKDFRTWFQYQNLMFITAGYLIEVLTGKTWEEFVQERIFDPLGMSKSNTSVEVSKQDANAALPYMESGAEVMEVPFRNLDVAGPAGSINSNVIDMAKWMMLHLKDGEMPGGRLVSSANLSVMHSPQMIMQEPIETLRPFIQTGDMTYPGYGLGWFTGAYRGEVMIQHGGSIDGFLAMCAFLPNHNLGAIVLSNLGNNPLPVIAPLNIFDRLLGLKEIDWNARLMEDRRHARQAMEHAKASTASQRVPDTHPSHPLDAYAGEYEHPGYGVFTITRQGDALVGEMNTLTFDLRHYHFDVFEMVPRGLRAAPVSFRAAFALDLDGAIQSVSIPWEPLVGPIIFARRACVSLSELRAVSGEYEIPGGRAIVDLRGDHLSLTMTGLPQRDLVPYRADEFQVKDLPGVTVRFARDKSGAMTVAIANPMGTIVGKRE